MNSPLYFYFKKTIKLNIQKKWGSLIFMSCSIRVHFYLEETIVVSTSQDECSQSTKACSLIGYTLLASNPEIFAESFELLVS